MVLQHSNNLKKRKVKKMELSKLENMFSLSCNVVVYVPSTYNVDKKIDNKKQVESVASLLADYFGGSTSEKCKGYYKANSGKMISEDIIKVYAFCDTESLNNNIDNVIAICENLKTEMKQESIALEINNKMYFV